MASRSRRLLLPSGRPLTMGIERRFRTPGSSGSFILLSLHHRAPPPSAHWIYGSFPIRVSMSATTFVASSMEP